MQSRRDRNCHKGILSAVFTQPVENKSQIGYQGQDTYQPIPKNEAAHVSAGRYKK